MITPEARALIAECDRRAPGVGLRPGEWPYGPNVDLDMRAGMLDWAERHGLRASRGRDCLVWLRKGRCADAEACYGHGGAPHRYGWMDHVTTWQRDAGGTRVLLAQPYGLTDEDRDELRCLGKTFDVRIFDSGWYTGADAVEVWCGA